MWEYEPLAAGTTCETWGYCDGVDTFCIRPETGGILPRYQIAGVTYSPPGVNSSVEYGAGAKTGTTTSTTASWNSGLTIKYETGLSLPMVGGGIEIGFSANWSGSTTVATDIVLSASTSTKVSCSGVCDDYLDHGDDQILLILGPKVNVLAFADTSDLPSGVPAVRWGLDLSQSVPQVVKVAWLNGSEPMPMAVANTLAAYGVSNRDYPAILEADPYAQDRTGLTRPDPARFEYLGPIPYEPTLPNQYKWTTSNDYTSSYATASSFSYGGNATWTGKALGNKLAVSGSFTWTNSSSSSNTSSISGSSTLTFGMPSSSFAGPTVIHVYLDKVFKTFMFSYIH